MSSCQNSAKVEAHILRRFDLLKKVGSGAYGHVWKVQDKTTKTIYALKKIFDAFQHATDAQRTYREVSILKQLDHENIIKLKQTIKAENPKDIYLVFQYMEADLHNVINEGILKLVHNRYIVYQIAKALKYLQTAKLIHRDLKPSNILLNSNCHVKICDFGLVRCVGGSEDSNAAVMTEGVATRWYRAPEVLLGSRSYEYPADIWSFGCIIYEIFFRKPLFNGNSTLDQLEKIIEFTGYPSAEDIASLESDLSKTMISEVESNKNTTPEKRQEYLRQLLREGDSDLKDLLLRMLQFNPKKRISIEEVLSHPLVKDFRRVEEEKTCQVEIKTVLDDNKKLSVDNYRSVLYHRPTRSESKTDTPSKKVLVLNSSTNLAQCKSDKKLPSNPSITTTAANMKSSENLKPLMKSVNGIKTIKSTSFIKPGIQPVGSPKQQIISTKPLVQSVTNNDTSVIKARPITRPMEQKNVLNMSSKNLSKVNMTNTQSPTAISSFNTSVAGTLAKASVAPQTMVSKTILGAAKVGQKQNGLIQTRIVSPKASISNLGMKSSFGNIISPKNVAARKIVLNSPNPLPK